MKESTDDLTEKLEEKRKDLKDTVSTLEERLSPEDFIRRLSDSLSGEPQEFARNFGRQVREQPIPTLLTAVGLTMLMTGDRRGHSNGHDDDYDDYQRFERLESVDRRVRMEPGEDQRSYARRMRDHQAYALDVERLDDEDENGFQRRIEEARDRASGAARRFRERMSEAGYSANRQTRRAAAKTQSAAEQAYRMAEENPIALGAIGVALGALAGGSLPLTRAEEKQFGRHADNVLAKASEHVASAAEAGKEAVETQRQKMAEQGDTL